jgi:phosphopantetheinyl transferase
MTISASTIVRTDIRPGDLNRALVRADAHRPRRVLAARGRPFVPGEHENDAEPAVPGKTTILFASLGAVYRSLGASEILSPEELAHAETLRQPADRARYRAARMLLRHALSKAAGGEIGPAEWRYRDAPNGKPMLAASFPAIEFNISHSDGCVAVAVSKDGPVGIDLECVACDLRSGIVEDVLTAAERDSLLQLSTDEKWRRFMRIWTAKEACAKALGLGLGLDFRRMEVGFDPLRVLISSDFGPARFEVAMRDLSRNSRPYCLAVARTTDDAWRGDRAR